MEGPQFRLDDVARAIFLDGLRDDLPKSWLVGDCPPSSGVSATGDHNGASTPQNQKGC